jgi:hypothetical protein
MHRLSPVVLVLATLLGVTAAQAVPLAFTHQARLLDGSGAPLVGAHSVRFSIYAQASGGSAVWTEQASVQFDEGMMSHVLGSVTPLVLEDFDVNFLYLGISVDSSPELAPRVPLASVPFAFRAHSAENATNVTGGIVDASEIRINGSVVLDGSGAVLGDVSFNDLIDVPGSLLDGDDDTLADLSCTNGQVARFSGGLWACGDADDHVHSAEDITSGTLSIDRIPVGSTSSTVAAGDHVHSFGQITGELPLSRTNGSLDVARVSGNLPLAQTSGNLDIARTTGDIPADRLPASLEAIAALDCDDGEVPKRNGSSWECGSAGGGGGGGTLIGNWEFDESNGTTFADSSGLGNNLTAPTGGQAAGSGGHSGSAVNFSGGVLQAANGNTIPDSPYVSVEAWVRPTSITGTQTILHKTGAYKLTQEAGKFAFEIRSQHTVGGVSSCKVTHGVAASTGAWAQARGFYNGREIGVSLDGHTVTAPCALGPIKYTTGQTFFVGGEGLSPTQAYDGRLDEVRVWRAAADNSLGYNVASGSLPTCDASLRGAIRYTAGGTNEVDTLSACMRDINGSYRWNTIVQSSGQFRQSTLMNSTQQIQVNSWIGSPNANWTLCYKKSVNGGDASTFHSMCNNRGETVTVARLSTGVTIGGYSGNSWANTNTYQSNSANFLFSLTNNHKYTSPGQHGSFRIYDHQSYGPTWGGGHDWHIQNNLNGGYCNLGHDYACRTGSYGATTCHNDFCGNYSSWSIVDLEVFYRN